MNTNRLCKSSSIMAISILIITLLSPFAFCAGQVKYYDINSDILAQGGEKAQRELGVYLPEGYDASGESYPVLYLIHGFGGNNRTFLGSGYNGLMNEANVSLIVDRLIEDGKIMPLIVACPDVSRNWGSKGGIIAPYSDYLFNEIIPFVDTNFRTIPKRECRAISGHSNGGYDSLYMILSNPDTFSLSGGYASGTPEEDPLLNLLGPMIKKHNQILYPIEFWIYIGRNDDWNFTPSNRDFVAILDEYNLPFVYVEDDGNHFNIVPQRLEESIIFFSQFLNGSMTTVKSSGEIANTWGNIKQ